MNNHSIISTGLSRLLNHTWERRRPAGMSHSLKLPARRQRSQGLRRCGSRSEGTASFGIGKSSPRKSGLGKGRRNSECLAAGRLVRFGYRTAIIPTILLLAFAFFCFCASSPAQEKTRWWKGNLHTHTHWSDGDDYPEMVTEWYKKRGYHFLALSDHNVLLEGEKWISITNSKGGEAAFKKYLARFGEQWVTRRTLNGTNEVRLKTLEEFRGRFEERDRFLMIPSEEITDRYKVLPVHINATNPREFIKGRGGSNVFEVMQNNVNAVLEQRARTGQPMFPHLNHPNFVWGVTAEELMRVRGERFFEVYNGHPSVHNEGDQYHASTERMWDIILSFRLTELGMDTMYGLAVDDAHDYHSMRLKNSNPGRGWVMVRAARLDAESIIAAMEAGDFYASNGVRLKTVQRGPNRLALEIEAEPGVIYTTQFIGTRKGFDPTSQPGARPAGSPWPVTRQYSAEIGAVLAEVKGTSPDYTVDGDELYVRAKVMSSKPKENPYLVGEFEMAWTQPLVLKGK